MPHAYSHHPSSPRTKQQPPVAQFGSRGGEGGSDCEQAQVVQQIDLDRVKCVCFKSKVGSS
jgi:hypothetical protein